MRFLFILFLFIISIGFVPSFAGAHGFGDFEVHITPEGFEPERIEVPAGGTVVFENTDDQLRWPASNIHPTHTLYPGSDIRQCTSGAGETGFDSCRGLESGERFSFTFKEVGEWEYHDHLNAGDGGTIVVIGEGGSEEPIFSSQSIKEGVRFFFYKVFYWAFPSRLEKRFEEVEVDEIVYDDRQLEFFLRIAGYNRVIDELLKDSYLGELNGTPIYHCHTPAHYVGRMTYRLFNKTAFDEGLDSRCDFGFYHGTLEAFLSEKAGEKDVVSSLHERCLGLQDETVRIFCEHGIGHGVLVFNNYDVPEAVRACQSLPVEAQELCYHGLFMENAFADLGLGVGHETEWADDARPDFPCTTLAQMFRDEALDRQCYFGQSLLWAAPFAQFNLRAVLEGCKRAPQHVKDMCYAGLGFSAGAPDAFMDDTKLLSTCSAAPNSLYRDFCFAGVFFMRATVWQEKGNLDKSLFCSVAGFKNVELCEESFRDMLSWVFNR